MSDAPVPTARDGSPLPLRDRPTYGRDLRAMFTHIARGYEWFDHVASLGQDFLWRPVAIWGLEKFRGPARPIRRILDVGCGTGELTRLVARRYPSTEVVGLDFTAAMVALARRTTPGELGRRIRWVRGDAQRLPFRRERFDLIVSAFVARNLPDLPGALGELHRVTAPGGAAMILDITGPSHPLLRKGFEAYFGHVVPWMGAAIGSEGPYTYLPRSLAHLPPPDGFVAELRRAGFARAAARPLSGGVVTAFLADTQTRQSA